MTASEALEYMTVPICNRARGRPRSHRGLVVCTAPTAPKVSALAARPHVALTIDTDEAPFKALLIRGVAEVEVVNGGRAGVHRRLRQIDGRPVVGDVRGAGSWRVQADGQDLDYAAMGRGFTTSAPAAYRPSCARCSELTVSFLVVRLRA